MQNLSSGELCAFCTLSTFYLVNFVDLFYPDGAMRHNAKSNILNQIERDKYSLPYLMENPDLGATITDFMVILQPLDYNKFERFSNVADEISTKLLSSFLECEVLVAVTDGYDFEFSREAAERKGRTEDSTHTQHRNITFRCMQEIEIIDSQNIPKSFQSYFGISNIKPW